MYHHIELNERANGQLPTSGTKVQEITGSTKVLLINGVIMVQLLTKEHLRTGIGDTIV